jgi:conjugative transposon TraN protein
MKRLCAVWMVLFSLTSHGQRSIPSLSLSVTVKKTTNIIFPYRIEKADIGSADVIGHKDQNMGNVLFLKAARKDIAPTNLSIYTSDGKFYSFIIRYKEDPDTLNLSFLDDPGQPVSVMDSFISAKLYSDAVSIQSQPSFLHKKAKAQEIKVILKGIYLMDDLLWFRFTIKNHSEISYRPVFIRFFIKDKKTGNRSAMQESPVAPSWSSFKTVSGNQKEDYGFGILSFTISSGKKLVFQMEEKNGERTIQLDIPSKTILKSRPVEQN